MDYDGHQSPIVWPLGAFTQWMLCVEKHNFVHYLLFRFGPRFLRTILQDCLSIKKLGI